MALFALVACSSEAPQSPRERFEAELGAHVCDVAWPRACGGERAGPACSFVEGFIPLSMSLLENQGGSFNEDAARLCMERLRAEPVVGHEVRCAGVMRGTLRPGAPCTSSLQCAPTDVGVTRCRGESEAGLEDRRVCEVRVRAALGQPCVLELEDAPSSVRYVCDRRVAFCSEETRRCTAKPTEGEACTPFPSHRSENVGCTAGHFCDGGGVCRRARGEGAACDEAAGDRLSCAPGLRCSDDRECVRPTRGAGEPCGHDSECLVGTCHRGACDPSEPDELGDVGVLVCAR